MAFGPTASPAAERIQSVRRTRVSAVYCLAAECRPLLNYHLLTVSLPDQERNGQELIAMNQKFRGTDFPGVLTMRPQWL